MKDSTKEKVKKITEQLEQGVQDLFSSEKYAEYLRFVGKFHRYSANNCLLIAMQMPEASMVAGFKKWQELGRFVKKGSKGIAILAPIQRKFMKEVENEKGEKTEEEVKYLAFMPTYVFDVSQTDGAELPGICEDLTGDAEEELIEKVISISPVPVQFGKVPGKAKGFFHKDGYIVIREGMSGQQTLKTLVHEIAHSILHCKGGEEEKTTGETKEVQAESTAYAVCSYFGIDTSDYSFGYVAGWSSGKEVKELQASLDVIQKTASSMIEQIEAA